MCDFFYAATQKFNCMPLIAMNLVKMIVVQIHMSTHKLSTSQTENKNHDNEMSVMFAHCLKYVMGQTARSYTVFSHCTGSVP